MTDPARCPACGTDLPEGAAPGPCQACLLKAGLEEDARAKPRFAPPAIAELQPHFPELEILALIGHGGMGAVYQARQKRLERMVALKVLAPELGGDPAFAERFAREARALARLSHPHLVAVHDFGQSGPWFWILMEQVEGANLRQVLATGALSASQALAIVPQLCEALQYAHDEGIVHRDIKPENILLDRRGQAKIADFGLAKLAPGDASPSDPLTATGDLMGTAHYMAPEQIERAASVDHRADLYSLGVVIYEMLTGGLPLGRFEAPSHKAQVDARLDQVVNKALEKDPARRYQNTDEIRTDVERIGAGPAAAAATTEPEDHLEIAGVLLLVAAVAMASIGIFRLATADSHPGGVDTLGAALSLLPLAIAIGVGGKRALDGVAGRWFLIARVLAVVAIAPASECSDLLTVGLAFTAAYLFGASWPRRIIDKLREVNRTAVARRGLRAPAAGAPQPAQEKAGESSDDNGWLALMMIGCIAVPAMISSPSSIPWIAVMVAAIALAVGNRRRSAPNDNSAASARHAIITGVFRLLTALVTAAAVLLLALIAAAAFRPELLPKEWRDHIHISIGNSQPQQQRVQAESPHG